MTSNAEPLWGIPQLLLQHKIRRTLKPMLRMVDLLVEQHEQVNVEQHDESEASYRAGLMLVVEEVLRGDIAASGFSFDSLVAEVRTEMEREGASGGAS